MDLNYLLYRQQIEQRRSKTAACEPARRSHAELARAYARLIGDFARAPAPVEFA